MIIRSNVSYMMKVGIKMNVMITPEKLAQWMSEESELIIIDVRGKYQDYDSGRASYEAGHIPGAIFLDVKEDVIGSTSFLPEPDAFAEKLGSLGIDENAKLVLYDAGNHRPASKVWVALHALGHERAYILNGGFKTWVDNGYETSGTIERKSATNYRPNIQVDKVMTLTDVKQNLQDDAITLIDSRGYERFSGQNEPKYKKAGHIPGAINYEIKQTLNQDGTIKEQTALQKHFAAIPTDEKIVVSCGSGNSACVNVVALKEAGYENVALYAGGFSEWIEDDDNEVSTEKSSK